MLCKLLYTTTLQKPFLYQGQGIFYRPNPYPTITIVLVEENLQQVTTVLKAKFSVLMAMLYSFDSIHYIKSMLDICIKMILV